MCESRPVAPLLTSAASAPWHPSHADAGILLTTTDVGNVTQGQGFRITKCYPSVVRILPVVAGINHPHSMHWAFLLSTPCCGA